jgi:hypothetical protein
LLADLRALAHGAAMMAYAEAAAWLIDGAAACVGLRVLVAVFERSLFRLDDDEDEDELIFEI